LSNLIHYWIIHLFANLHISNKYNLFLKTGLTLNGLYLNLKDEALKSKNVYIHPQIPFDPKAQLPFLQMLKLFFFSPKSEQKVKTNGS